MNKFNKLRKKYSGELFLYGLPLSGIGILSLLSRTTLYTTSIQIPKIFDWFFLLGTMMLLLSIKDSSTKTTTEEKNES